MPQTAKVILLIDNSREYDRGILRGIARYNSTHAPWMSYHELAYLTKPMAWKSKLSWFKRWNADGIIVRDEKGIDELIAMDLPIIVLPNTRPYPNLPHLVGDDARIGRMAAEYFVGRGFEHFAYCGFNDLWWSQVTAESFTEAVLKAGYEAYVYEQPKTQRKRIAGIEEDYIAEWLKPLPKPVAVLASVDERAQQVAKACRINGLHVPHEVAILGVDNDETICRLSNPLLSSISQDSEKAGYEAAALLTRLMAGEKMANQRIVVEATHIVSRQSTDILATEDSRVNKALSYIFEHSMEQINVDNVVRAAATNRRTLERCFRRIVGRSVHSQIRYVRIERVTESLMEANETISQIAFACGYDNVKQMERHFVKEKAMSPLAYRKKHRP